MNRRGRGGSGLSSHHIIASIEDCEWHRIHAALTVMSQTKVKLQCHLFSTRLIDAMTLFGLLFSYCEVKLKKSQALLKK